MAASLRRLRKQRGWSQEGLADEGGLDRAYISGFERLTKNLTILVVQRISEAFGCTMGGLLDLLGEFALVL